MDAPLWPPACPRMEGSILCALAAWFELAPVHLCRADKEGCCWRGSDAREDDKEAAVPECLAPPIPLCAASHTAWLLGHGLHGLTGLEDRRAKGMSTASAGVLKW